MWAKETLLHTVLGAGTTQVVNFVHYGRKSEPWHFIDPVYPPLLKLYSIISMPRDLTPRAYSLVGDWIIKLSSTPTPEHGRTSKRAVTQGSVFHRIVDHKPLIDDLMPVHDVMGVCADIVANFYAYHQFLRV